MSKTASGIVMLLKYYFIADVREGKLNLKNGRNAKSNFGDNGRKQRVGQYGNPPLTGLVFIRTERRRIWSERLVYGQQGKW